jgi:hypothetical protein
MREALGAACAFAAGFMAGWGVRDEQEHARWQKRRARFDLDARVDEDDLAAWEAEMEER